jgi:hypothetical protein
MNYVELFITEFLKPLTVKDIQKAIAYLKDVDYLEVEAFARRAKDEMYNNNLNSGDQLVEIAREMYKYYVKSLIPDIESHVDLDNFTLKESKAAFARYIVMDILEADKNGILPEQLDEIISTHPILSDPVIQRLMEKIGMAGRNIFLEVVLKSSIRVLKFNSGGN